MIAALLLGVAMAATPQPTPVLHALPTQSVPATVAPGFFVLDVGQPAPFLCVAASPADVLKLSQQAAPAWSLKHVLGAFIGGVLVPIASYYARQKILKK